mgnify:CR=1 FL=1
MDQIYSVILQKGYIHLISRELEELLRWGNELATVLIAVVCIALLVLVTLTDAKV